MPILPRRFPQRPAPAISVSPLLLEAASCEGNEVLRKLGTSTTGLTGVDGRAPPGRTRPQRGGQGAAFSPAPAAGQGRRQPAGDPAAGPGGRFLSRPTTSGPPSSCCSWSSWASSCASSRRPRADNAAAKLKAMISVTATVLRDGQPREVPLGQLVPGDVVKLAAGDMIPADLRLVSCKDLFVIQSSLTGESLPGGEIRRPGDRRAPQSPLELKNICFLGTSVESGTAPGVIVATGLKTYLGSMAAVHRRASRRRPASTRASARFTWLMIRFMVVMVPLVFLINGLTKHDWKEAFFFAAGRGRRPDARKCCR